MNITLFTSVRYAIEQMLTEQYFSSDRTKKKHEHFGRQWVPKVGWNQTYCWLLSFKSWDGPPAAPPGRSPLCAAMCTSVAELSSLQDRTLTRSLRPWAGQAELWVRVMQVCCVFGWLGCS